MATKLLIAGHGRRRNRTFDGGAYGYMTMGEHKYFENHLFPAMRKFLPDNADVVFHTKYNVYSYGNLVSLANSYGSDTEVYEFHFDALTMGSSASGGHVIIYSGYVPDSMDLALRDVIDDMVGVRYSHKGYKGISGRNNLANVNRAANGSINYRLLELGFGTNRGDSNVMLNQTDKYAKKLVETIFGSSSNANVTTSNKNVNTSKATNIDGKSIDELAQEVIQGNYGSGQDRKNALGNKYSKVQNRVNEILTGTSSTTSTPDRTIRQVAQDVIDGKYGNGSARKRNVEADGYNYQTVQNEVNRILGGGSSSGSGKSISQMAKEVLDSGITGNQARANYLGMTLDEYQPVRDEINNRFRGSSTGGSVNIESIAQQIKKGIDNQGNNIPTGHTHRKNHFNLTQAQYNKVRARVNRIM